MRRNECIPDLYYRLSAFTVNVPALRHRKEEIGILLRYSMRKLSKYYDLAPRDFYSIHTRGLSESLVAWKLEGIGNVR